MMDICIVSFMVWVPQIKSVIRSNCLTCESLLEKGVFNVEIRLLIVSLDVIIKY